MTFSLVCGFGRDLQQTEVALAPVADRLDPQRWLEFPMRFVIVKCVEGTAALQKSETARIEVGESRDLQGLAVGDRAPEPFAASGQNLQSGRLVDGGADVIDKAMVEAAEQVGRGHGSESQFVDCRPRYQRRLGVDDGRFELGAA